MKELNLGLKDILEMKIPQFFAVLQGYSELKEEEKRMIEKEIRKREFFSRVRM
ncbi:hypothetical protein [Geoglobus ahangari]